MQSGGQGSGLSSTLACCGQQAGHLAPWSLSVLTHEIWPSAPVGPEALLPPGAPRSTYQWLRRSVNVNTPWHEAFNCIHCFWVFFCLTRVSVNILLTLPGARLSPHCGSGVKAVVLALATVRITRELGSFDTRCLASPQTE